MSSYKTTKNDKLNPNFIPPPSLKKSKPCPWSGCCRNGGDGCFTTTPETCVRFLPLEGTNLTKIDCIIETPPDIDSEKFSQYFVNWIDSMGWSHCGVIAPESI